MLRQAHIDKMDGLQPIAAGATCQTQIPLNSQSRHAGRNLPADDCIKPEAAFCQPGLSKTP